MERSIEPRSFTRQRNIHSETKEKRRGEKRKRGGQEKRGGEWTNKPGVVCMPIIPVLWEIIAEGATQQNPVSKHF